MKSLISIDNKDLSITKELYILQNFGDKKPITQILADIDTVIILLKNNAKLSIVDGTFNLYFNNEIAYLKESEVLAGKNVSCRLKGCKRAYFFIVTLGAEVDRLINKYQYTNLSLSFLIDSVSSVLIDVLAQKIQDKLSEKYNIIERYSCGYGDYLLSLQQNICELLKSDKIGVKLTNGGMFYPTKTISAVIGIKGEKNV